MRTAWLAKRDAAHGRKHNKVRHAALSLVAAAMLAACGGGGESTDQPVSGATNPPVGGTTNPPVGGTTNPPAGSAPETPSDKAAAARFLTQATFGPNDAEIDRVMAIGYGAWIDEQWGKPVSNHRANFEVLDAAAKAAGQTSIWQDGVTNTFWKHAIGGEDQLRQRVAYALSQIMVISMQDGTVGDNPRAVSAYIDMLAYNGAGQYRALLEAVALHPMMGVYLSHLKNQKADPLKGRVPDENFAREVMQLFSIGVHQLNTDGSPRMNGNAAVESYTDADISGLAKVFTGWSWDCPDGPDNNCFYWGSVNNVSDPDRSFKPMQGFPQFHSKEEKKFLGTTIAAQSVADPRASLTQALDHLAAHPNVGPFLGKQLIQRLVTSNPSPAYVSAVAAVFNNNGSGVRGDMKAVVKAILMHPEARVVSDRSGKVREPVLRMTAFARALGHKSDTGSYRVSGTDNPGTSLGQSPLKSASVFNFYRPGYVAPGSQSAGAGLVAPELQILHETSAAGYVNTVRDAVDYGYGSWNPAPYNRPDLQADYTPFMALSDKPVDLVQNLNTKLMYGTMPAALKTEIEGAVASIAIPALNAGATNQTQIDNAKRTRVKAALFLTMVSPEFQVQR